MGRPACSPFLGMNSKDKVTIIDKVTDNDFSMHSQRHWVIEQMDTNDPLDEQMGQRRTACTLFPEDEASGQSSCRLRDCQIPQKCSQKFSKALGKYTVVLVVCCTKMQEDAKWLPNEFSRGPAFLTKKVCCGEVCHEIYWIFTFQGSPSLTLIHWFQGQIPLVSEKAGTRITGGRRGTFGSRH